MTATTTPETIVYGGSFNPPTKAHEAILSACLQHNPEADVWVMPSGERRDKQHGISLAHRLGMLGTLAASLEGGNRLAICTDEIEDDGLTETYISVERLAREYPDRNFRFVFGADAYQSMPTWERGEDMQANLPMIVIPRGDIALPDAENVEIMPVDITCSSTEIRSRVAQGLSIEDIAPQAIVCYIRQHKLYGPCATVA